MAQCCCIQPLVWATGQGVVPSGCAQRFALHNQLHRCWRTRSLSPARSCWYTHGRRCRSPVTPSEGLVAVLVPIHSNFNTLPCGQGCAVRVNISTQSPAVCPLMGTEDETQLGIRERCVAAAGAAFVAATIVNPLDVIKVHAGFYCCLSEHAGPQHAKTL